jgi:hydrogenase maturation protein HypF
MKTPLIDERALSDYTHVDAHFEIRVTGVVQGVGFRPFVYRTALNNHLTGKVWNHSQGVTIHVQGGLSDLRAFVSDLKEMLPPAARIDELSIEQCLLCDFHEFAIAESEESEDAFALIPPDLALCEECRSEFLSAADRRYKYPFINCTNCGPRFSIIKSVPYDRPATTMAPFMMCEKCSEEYENPRDRRFHAQPVACWECGPQIQFYVIVEGEWCTTNHECDPVVEAARLLVSSGIVIIQGVGGYHLACDASDELAVRELRRRKRRDEKPLAVMFPDMESLEEWCNVTSLERECLLSPRAPIVLLDKKESCPVAESVAPMSVNIGAMLPYSPLHLALLNQVGIPLVMTSANLSDDPIEFEESSLRRRISHIADGALLHNRAIHMFTDDSVVRVAKNRPRVWRRSRGYVPESIRLSAKFNQPTLGFGADLKNSFAIGKGECAILSQYLGNLESAECAATSERALRHMLNLFDARIGRVACDLHPDYHSTRLAEEWSGARNLPLVRVQHHHAHLSACLAEHGVSCPALGLILDGTGLGTDGTIWGGELLFGNHRSFMRVGKLTDVPMIGNDAAAREPWRMTLAWLYQTFVDELRILRLPILETIYDKLGSTGVSLLLNPSVQKSFMHTSSMGRLFDAVAALIGFGVRTQYEGQAAMWLEGVMARTPERAYNISVEERNGLLVLDPCSMIREMVIDIHSGVSRGILSRRFHESVAFAWSEMVLLAAEMQNTGTVALSGGCFQNRFMLERICDYLELKKMHVLIPQNIPCNDGAIALGQICIANAQEM